jgi:hypothetical protein
MEMKNERPRAWKAMSNVRAYTGERKDLVDSDGAGRHDQALARAHQRAREEAQGNIRGEVVVGMLNAKCIMILKGYAKDLERLSLTDEMRHLQTMIPKAIGFFEEGRREKGFRWLGFIQGVLWMENVYTIEEMKNHNRPDSGNHEEE